MFYDELGCSLFMVGKFNPQSKAQQCWTRVWSSERKKWSKEWQLQHSINLLHMKCVNHVNVSALMFRIIEMCFYGMKINRQIIKLGMRSDAIVHSAAKHNMCFNHKLTKTTATLHTFNFCAFVVTRKTLRDEFNVSTAKRLSLWCIHTAIYNSQYTVWSAMQHTARACSGVCVTCTQGC